MPTAQDGMYARGLGETIIRSCVRTGELAANEAGLKRDCCCADAHLYRWGSERHEESKRVGSVVKAHRNLLIRLRKPVLRSTHARPTPSACKYAQSQLDSGSDTPLLTLGLYKVYLAIHKFTRRINTQNNTYLVEHLVEPVHALHLRVGVPGGQEAGHQLQHLRRRAGFNAAHPPRSTTEANTFISTQLVSRTEGSTDPLW